MRKSYVQSVLFVSIATLAAGLASPAQAALNLADKPLYLGTTIKPAFIMAIDDSGSMNWEVLSPNQDGELVWGRDTSGSEWGFFRNDGTLRSTSNNNSASDNWLELFPYANRFTHRRPIPPIPAFGFARSPEFNAGYYNPAVRYEPWKNFDGSDWDSMDSAAKWSNMKVDARADTSFAPTAPALDANLRFDLTTDIYDRIDDGLDNDVFQIDTSLNTGDVLRPNWQIRNQTDSNQTCSTNLGNLVFPRSGGGYTTLSSTYVLTGSCTTVRVRKRDVTNPEIDSNSQAFEVATGMVIPAGTTYFAENVCGGFGTTFNTLGEWTTLTSDLTVNAACNIAFKYYAPTYYLTTPTSPDGNIAPTAFVNQPGGPRSTTSPGNGTLYRYEIKPTNYATFAQYQAAMTNFANFFTYYRSRNLAMVAALTRSLNDVRFMRIGQFQINDTNYSSQYNTTLQNNIVMHEMADFTDSTSVAGRKRLYNQMIKLEANGSTPNAWAVAAMADQFTKTSGTNISGPPVQSVCQFNAGMLFTDGYHNQNRPTSFGNVDNTTPYFGVDPLKDNNSNTLADIAAHYYRTNIRPDLTAGLVPVVPGCAAATPNPRLDCNRNLHMNLYGITLGATGAQFGVNYLQDPNTLEITPDVYTAGNAPSWPGFANDSRSSVDDLWHATLNSRGQYINATSPDRITQAMNAIIESINNSARRSAGTAASGARRAVGFTAYVPEFDPNSWTGDLKAYTLQPDGMLGSVVWSAVDELPDPADREIYITKRNSGNTAFELKELNLSNLGTSDTQRRALLGLTDAQFTSGGEFNGRTMAEVVNWVRGDAAREGNAPGLFRQRLLRNADGTTEHRPIGDILGSQPEVLGRGTEGWSVLPTNEGGRVNFAGEFVAADTPGTYANFVGEVKLKRKPAIFVSSNAGMVHGFDASINETNSGKEIFAIMPNSVLSKTGALMGRNYAHQFSADGSPRLADACIGPAQGVAACGWKTVLVSGMGTGGRSVIALDVTDPVVGFNEDNFLWEYSSATGDNGTADPDMGFVINRPRVFLGEDRKWYAAFGNGVNSDNHRAYVYIVNLKTGKLARKIPLGTAGSAADPNGAVNVAIVNGDGDKDRSFDEEQTPYDDTMYVNDFHGRLWKLDLSSQNPADWAVAFGGNPMYTPEALDTAERADKRQFVTGGIDIAGHPLRGNMVFFGTGRYLAVGDQNIAAIPQVQSFYAIWDDPQANQAIGFTGRGSLIGQSITGAETVDLNNDGIFEVFRTTSSNPVPYTGTGAKRGWYFDIYQPGVGGFRSSERVIGVPRVVGGSVIFTTFQPIGSECNPGGKNFLYGLSAVTGAKSLSVPGCAACGGVDLNPTGQAAPPTPEPPIVVDPGFAGVPPANPGDPTPGNQRDCLPGTPGCDRTLPLNATLNARQCTAQMSVLLSTGLTPFQGIPCGRQAWRQLR
ncbi:pilus assembly protein [Pseudomarimonas arenosa]|uniref:PilY1 beta-propeller domain-containing protein n=1 Tax=Pseudomarimonas arenosa TaxID=2774145 RepID=A0AAW3ZPK0_9GAMM|nr:PilC/PilY family type IV pilus protein [Pseudomarimonas arenosa]MBD8528046.1 hypothetical protein [Pseudomarimonas arenosa]